MEDDLRWCFDGERERESRGIEEPRAGYGTDLAENDLIAWKNAVDLAIVIHEVSKTWPKDELYGLTNQIRRASVSVAANIAEGQGREGRREFLHHLSIAHGSLRETETLLVIGRRKGYVTDADFELAAGACQEARKPLRGLINYLKKEDPGGS